MFLHQYTLEKARKKILLGLDKDKYRTRNGTICNIKKAIIAIEFKPAADYNDYRMSKHFSAFRQTDFIGFARGCRVSVCSSTPVSLGQRSAGTL